MIIKEKSKEELKEWFIEEIKKRDKIIDNLKTENLMLMKTALKKANEHVSKDLKKRDQKKEIGG